MIHETTDRRYFSGEEGVYYDVQHDKFVRLTNRSFMALWHKRKKTIRRVYRYDLEGYQFKHRQVAIKNASTEHFQWMGEP